MFKSLPAQSEFLPKISNHVTDNVVLIDDSYYAFVIKMEGLAFDGVDARHIYSQFIGLKDLFSSIGKTFGNRAAIWTTLRRSKIEFNQKYGFHSAFCQKFADHYLERFQTEDYFENTFFLTLIIKNNDLKTGIKEAEEQIQILMKGLEPYSPTLLGTWENEHGVGFSEVYQFFGSLINGNNTPIPLTATDAYQIIPAATLHFGSDICEIRPEQGERKYAQMYDLKDFGISKPKIFTEILTLPFEFTLTQSMLFINPHEMVFNMKKQVNNLQSVGDLASEQITELEYGMGGLTTGELMFGDYNAALVVFGKTPQETASNGARAYTTFLNSGAYRFAKAGHSAPSTWYAQVPNSKERPRSFPKTTENLACTFGIHNYSYGKKHGNPLGDGSAIMPLQTVSKTLFNFNFHFTNPKEDNIGEKIAGHTLILGATGTGKTTLQTALLAFTERFNPYLFALDLDRGMELFIRVIGGSYFALENGKPTGLNPFQLPDTPTNREFLYELVGICGRSEDGKLTAQERQEIQTAVNALFEMDFEYRSFSYLLQSIPYDATNPDCLRVRLSEWCRSENGRFAWVLDNERNLFNPHDFWRIGFDLSDILKDKYKPTEPVLAYLFHLRELMLDKVAEQNGLLVNIIEEFWYPLRFKFTEELMLKMLKTDRKRGSWLVLVSQSPEDAIKADIFPAIVQQTPTKIFLPNPDAEFKDSYERCGLTLKEYQELVKKSLDSRIFLVKQSKQSAFAKLDLYGFKDEMVFLSGSSDNIELLHEVMAEYGDDVSQWYEPFMKAIHDRRADKYQSIHDTQQDDVYLQLLNQFGAEVADTLKAMGKI